MSIPRVLFRSVPAETSEQVETWWQTACDLHPDWRHLTYRDPIDPLMFPITSPYWDRCHNGAQLAGLVRLEALWTHGGFWLDSDINMFRSLEPLRQHKMVAAWEDENTVPDAFLAAEPSHPAVWACMDLAVYRLLSDSADWTTGNGAWATGPGVTTTVLPGRDDVTLLPRDVMFHVHYSEKERCLTTPISPKEYGRHMWAGSWL